MFESQTNFLQNLEIKVHMESKFQDGSYITSQYWIMDNIIQDIVSFKTHYIITFITLQNLNLTKCLTVREW